MGQRLRIPGGREVRATLDGTDDSDALVVACPPHPQMGGDRSDSRLRAVGDALVDRGVDCLRIDYGAWDGGRGEQTDVRSALGWGREGYRRVGLFGYSFGGTVALLAAAAAFEAGTATPDAVSVLAPAAAVGDGLDAASAVAAIESPLQVVSGTRDTAVDSEPVAERASEHGAVVERLEADHFYVGQRTRMATLVADFLARWL
jgi:hypothetical protein